MVVLFRGAWTGERRLSNYWEMLLHIYLFKILSYICLKICILLHGTIT